MMRFLLPFVAVVIFDLSACFGAPAEDWPTALIHDQQIALEYLLETQNYPDCECLKEFKDSEKDCRRRACLNYLVDAISFSPKPDNVDYMKEEFKALVVDTFKANNNPIYIDELTFKAFDKREENSKEIDYVAPAQMCIAQPDQNNWAMSAGYHEGVLVVFFKATKSEEFRLFGLLEEMPDVKEKLTKEEIAKLYEEGDPDEKAKKKAEAEKARKKADFAVPVPETDGKTGTEEKPSKSLCELTKNERFRACSVSFLASKHVKKEPYSGGHSIDSTDPSACIKSHIEIGEKRIPADILPCAVDKDATTPNLFITSDPHSPDSAFTVHQHDDHWHLGIRMTNMRVLRPFAKRPDNENVSISVSESVN